MANRRCPESHDLIRIACIGDSLTRGDGLHEHIPANRVPFQRLRPSQYALRKRGSYPALLARLAATQRAVVRNFGHGGATACNHTGGNGPPYESVPEYSAALRFAPHVVVLMLGTNDAKAHFWSAGPCSSWGHEHGHGLRTGLASIIGAFEHQPQLKLVLLLTPPPLLSARPIMGIDPALLQEAAVVISDVHTKLAASAGSMPRRALAHAAVPRAANLFSTDAVHLNADGSALLACIVYAHLQRLLLWPCGRADGAPTATVAAKVLNRTCHDPFCITQSDGPAAIAAAAAADRKVLLAAEVEADGDKRRCDTDGGYGSPFLYTGMDCKQAGGPSEPHSACERMAAAYEVDLRQGLSNRAVVTPLATLHDPPTPVVTPPVVSRSLSPPMPSFGVSPLHPMYVLGAALLLLLALAVLARQVRARPRGRGYTRDGCTATDVAYMPL